MVGKYQRYVEILLVVVWIPSDLNSCFYHSPHGICILLHIIRQHLLHVCSVKERSAGEYHSCTV